MAKKRASAHLTLILIGSAALTGCSDPPDQRDLYATRADCVQDWGDENKCEPASQHGSGSTRYYYGPSHSSPRYAAQPGGSLSAARPGSHAMATAHVSRGGFGSSGSHHSGGG